MDDYQPPPAFGFSPNGPTKPYSYSPHVPATQNNDIGFSISAAGPAYGIPGLQTASNTSQPSSFPALPHLWQQLQDNSLVPHTPNSFSTNAVQSVSTPADPLNLAVSDTAAAYIGENARVQEDLVAGLENEERVLLGDVETDIFQMARSESGEISDREVTSDEAGVEEGELTVDFTTGNSSSLVPPLSVPGESFYFRSPRSQESTLSRRYSPPRAPCYASEVECFARFACCTQSPYPLDGLPTFNPSLSITPLSRASPSRLSVA